MQVNSQFDKWVVVHAAGTDWLDSPINGVKRRMLDRIGGEVARATTIVSYAAGSSFTPHVHTGGEEFIVLEGVFQDEHGDFLAGSYIRNPPQSRHTPGSELGCVIFVKLWQFDPEDRSHVRTNFNNIAGVRDIERPGVWVTPLYRDQRENVRIEQWEAGSDVVIPASGGAEILVLDGSFEEGEDQFSYQSWLRVPVNTEIKAKAGNAGAKVWVKTGHLRYVVPPPE